MPMLVDARTLASGTLVDADLCIVGGGPAGLTLAHALSGAGIRIVLVETGGEKKDSDAEALLGGATRNSRFAPMTMYRRRVLGGASTIWGGRCVPMDPIDFAVRDHVPCSGWPVSFDDIAQFYPEATEICEAGRPDYDAHNAIPDAPPYIAGFGSDIVRTDSFERFSLPTNLWRRFSSELLPSGNVTILTHATVVDLTLGPDGANVDQAGCATLEGLRFRVGARKFVLACGGVEVFRLLAVSRAQRPAGLGNEHGVLGRYFMSHIEGSIASLQLNSPETPITWGFDTTDDGIYGRRRIYVDHDQQMRSGLLNTILRLHHANPASPGHRNAVLSMMFLAKSLILPEYRRKITMAERNAQAQEATGATFWLAHLRNVALGAPGLALFLTTWIAKRNLARRKMPYVVLASSTGTYPLDFNAEQEPNPDSRLLVANETDRFGVPFADVDWRMTENDARSVAETHRIIDAELRRSGVARLEYRDPDIEAEVARSATPIGGHHLGAARMGTDPKTSVVDANLRLHSVANLYVASGAVFPTSGHANPTLTILALALRLATHLKATAHR
jgi:choline dehydrogenase-like flavoprotein